MNLNNKRYERICNEFLQRCPIREDEIEECIAIHTHGIRVVLRNGDQIDYDGLSGLYKHRSASEVAARSSEDITDDACRDIFAENLKEYMLIRGVSRAELSRRTGLSLAAISKYLNKQSTPTMTTVMKIAAVLDCHYSELFI